jgi:hypothetical protein
MNQKWNLIKKSKLRKVKMKQEICYSSGKSNSSYKIDKLDFYYIPNKDVITDLGNSTLVSFRIVNKFNYIQDLFQKVIKTHEQVLHTSLISGCFTLNEEVNIYEKYLLDIENIIYQIKTCIDLLVQLIFVITTRINKDKIQKIEKIDIDNIGTLIYKKDDYLTVYNIVFGDDQVYLKDTTNFLKTINDLANSYKHCFSNVETSTFFSINGLSIQSLQIK